MEISLTERLKRLEAGGAEGIKRWLTVATQAYFKDKQGRWAFKGFEHLIGATESLTSDVSALYSQLSAEGRENFKDALVSILYELSTPIDADDGALWIFFVELAWTIPAPNTIKVMEWRFTEDFFNACRNYDGFFDQILVFVMNTAVTGPEAEQCVSRLVSSPRFHCSYSRQALLRLCEIAPDNWPRNFALTRDKLHEMFHELTMEERWVTQNELARDIYLVIGAERFELNVGDLFILRDSEWFPNDAWFLKSLISSQTLIAQELAGEWTVAPADRPTRRLRIPKYNISGDLRPSANNRDRSKTHISEANRCLGPSNVEYV